MDAKQIILAYLFLFGMSGAANLGFLILEKDKANKQGTHIYMY